MLEFREGPGIMQVNDDDDDQDVISEKRYC